MNRKQAESKINGYEETDVRLTKRTADLQDQINGLMCRLDECQLTVGYDHPRSQRLSDKIGLLMQERDRLAVTIGEVRSGAERIRADVVEGFIE